MWIRQVLGRPISHSFRDSQEKAERKICGISAGYDGDSFRHQCRRLLWVARGATNRWLPQVVDLVPVDSFTLLAICIQLQDHLEQANVQLSRECRTLRRMKLNPAAKNIDHFKFEDFELLD
jgi:hypothetical protein